MSINFDKRMILSNLDTIEQNFIDVAVLTISKAHFQRFDQSELC